MWAKNELAAQAAQAKQAVHQTLQPPKPKKTKPVNQVFWVQIAICGLLLGFAFLVKYFNLPTYEYFEKCYRDSLKNNAAAQEQQLIRFAMGVLEGVYDSAEAALAPLQQNATPESGAGVFESKGEAAKTAAPQNKAAASITRQTGAAANRIQHAKTPLAAPEGCSLKSGSCEQALQLPLPFLSVTSDYGWRKHPLTPKNDFHTGVDLAADEGTCVYAALPGYVRMAYYSSGYGNCLRLMHENGAETLYAHLQYLFAVPGQRVEQGALIGTVGQTGDATGPHLHFELLLQDIRYSPDEALGL